MPKFGKPEKYERPVGKLEVPQEILDAVKVFTDQGIDTAFPAEFAHADYTKEKLLIQRAANVHGFSVRELETNYDPDRVAPVKSKFVVRPMRKRKGEGQTAEAEPAASE